MKVSFHFSVFVSIICVCTSYSRRLENKKYDEVDQQIRSLLHELRNQKGRTIDDRRNSNSLHQKESTANDEKISKEHIDAIENQNVDPDSKYMELIESFQVLQRGKKLKPIDIHPEESKHVKAEAVDKHPLTHEQRVQLGLESERPGERDTSNNGVGKRGFTTGRLWNKGIVPYEIDQSLDYPEARDVIQKAIDIYDSLTCVRWRPHTETLETEVGHASYVNFFSGSGCWSSIGRTSNGKQSLSLKSPACVGVGIALHEMLHAMGQWHEQSRTDRDFHLYIQYALLGVQSGNANYGKFESRDQNPYDYESIEHYSLSKGFEALQPELGFLTSYGSGLSFYDIADITDAYRCTDGCSNPLECKNGGFLNFKCKCYCPYGLTGETCETVINSEECGGIIELIPGEETVITSPNFPNNYDVNSECVWLLKAPPNLHVRVEADVFHLPYDSENNRCYHWVEVKYNLVGQTGIRECGDSSGDVWTTSPWGEKNLMLLIFDSIFGKRHFPEKGFSLRAWTVTDGCIPDPCIYGVCKDCDGQAYRCECDPGFEGQNCDQLQASSTVECTFEKGRECFLTNIKTDEFDWKMYSGPTVSDLTGPEGAIEGENYMYAEASSPRKSGDSAVLESDITFPAQDRCLTFYYSMFGLGIGTLRVKSGSIELWSKSGDQGYGWRYASVDVPATSNLKIIIEAVRGSDWEGDIAIDDIKLSPGLCKPPVKSDCLTTAKGTEYMGTTNVTKGGLSCQRWELNSPHSHTYNEYNDFDNYCRNILGDEPAPWCYTTDPEKRWDFCSIPHCHTEECIRAKNGYDYMGTKATTTQGKACEDNKWCRSSGNDPAPWCYTSDPNTRWDTCDIPKCSSEPKECLLTPKGRDYFGTKSTTRSGSACQRWDSQSPNQHDYWYLEDQENFCRNSDDMEGPWCFSMDPTGGWEYCDIPYCDELGCHSEPCFNGGTCQNTENGGFKCQCRFGFEGEKCGTRVDQEQKNCKRSTTGYEYQGFINTTINNRTCQEWASDEPHGHDLNELPENYCRNPDKEPTPWCYTTDPYTRWEKCDIPFCTTPARECLESDKGSDYFGTVRHTKQGIECQKWSEQSPQSHSYAFIGDQDNYCRNPYGDEPLPWCYTSDPNTRWDFCDIPHC